jgi:signal transduction histidine kinase
VKRFGLWPYLFGLAALSIAVGLGVSLWVIHGAANREFGSYRYHGSLRLAIQVGSTLGRQYYLHGLAGMEASAQHLAQLLNSPVVMRNPAGGVIFRVKAPSGTVNTGPPVTGPILTPVGSYVGSVTILHTGGFTPRLDGFTASLDASLWVASAVGFILALILSGILGSRLLRPLHRIAEATRRLAAGDLGYRVRPAGPSEIYGLAEDFNTMAQHLETSVARQQQLIADVAHELRTPLSVLRGYLEAARDGVTVPGVDPLAEAERQATVLGRLVSDLQDLALADAHQLVLRIRPTSVPEILQPLADTWAAPAARAGIAFDTAVTAPDLVIEVDPDRLRQVLTNFLSNALRYAPRDGTGRIAVTAGRDGNMVRFAVTDNGPGIPPDAQPHVFERLYRGDPSRTRAPGTQGEGFGLGLAIAQSLVQMMGGTIGMESEPGQGTTFWCAFPARPAPAG